MYTFLSLVYLVVALTFSSCTAHRKGWWNSPRRPETSLRSLHCDKVEQFDLCSCCPVDPCNGVECLNGGQCVDGICECISGYKGPTCNISPCDGVECMNGGTCEGEGVCNCTFGFGGATCNMRVCQATECIVRGGSCVRVRCLANATNCGGTACNTTNDEVCIDDTCVARSGNCDTVIDGIFNNCFPIGEACGEGTSCSDHVLSPRICVNDTCRFEGKPIGGTYNAEIDDTPCSTLAGVGSYKDGVCFVQCSDDIRCGGFPCVGGTCADLYCGEPFCALF